MLRSLKKDNYGGISGLILCHHCHPETSSVQHDDKSKLSPQQTTMPLSITLMGLIHHIHSDVRIPRGHTAAISWCCGLPFALVARLVCDCVALRPGSRGRSERRLLDVPSPSARVLGGIRPYMQIYNAPHQQRQLTGSIAPVRVPVRATG